LNVSEFQLICPSDLPINDSLLQSFTRVSIDDTTLPGAPLFPGSALDKAWNKCSEELATASDRLRAINSQDALILLRSCFSAPKVLYLLRCSPSVAHASLAKFDDLLYLDVQFNTLPILISLTFSGRRPVYQLKMAAWESDVSNRWQFLPSWLLLRAHCPTKTTYT